MITSAPYTKALMRRGVRTRLPGFFAVAQNDSPPQSQPSPKESPLQVSE